MAGAKAAVGVDASSWAVDGERGVKAHRGFATEWGAKWKPGDILGCMADLDAKTLSFSLNGSVEPPMGVAFEGIEFQGGLFPVLSAKSCDVTCNFGEDHERPLAHLPDGYSPVVPPTKRGNLRGRLTNLQGWLAIPLASHSEF